MLQIFLHRLGGAPDASYRPREVRAGDAEFLGPIFDLIISLEADEFGVPRGELRLVVRHDVHTLAGLLVPAFHLWKYPPAGNAIWVTKL